MTKQLTSYYNNSELKQEILHEAREHVKNDQLVQGEGWNEEKQKGCFVGCLTHCYDHQKASIKLGIPIWLLRLADNIHEGLPPEKTGEFFIGFIDALQEGMTKQHTNIILHQFLYNALTKVIPHQYQTKPEIATIIDMFKNVLDGAEITTHAWRSAAAKAAKAANAVRSAADAATWAAAAVANAAVANAAVANVANAVAAAVKSAAKAAEAARSTAKAAAKSDAADWSDVAVRSAAWSAAKATNAAAEAEAAEYATTRQLSYEKMKNSLIQILKEIKIS